MPTTKELTGHKRSFPSAISTEDAEPETSATRERELGFHRWRALGAPRDSGQGPSLQNITGVRVPQEYNRVGNLFELVNVILCSTPLCRPLSLQII